MDSDGDACPPDTLAKHSTNKLCLCYSSYYYLHSFFSVSVYVLAYYYLCLFFSVYVYVLPFYYQCLFCLVYSHLHLSVYIMLKHHYIVITLFFFLYLNALSIFPSLVSLFYHLISSLFLFLTRSFSLLEKIKGENDMVYVQGYKI